MHRMRFSVLQPSQLLIEHSKGFSVFFLQKHQCSWSLLTIPHYNNPCTLCSSPDDHSCHMPYISHLHASLLFRECPPFYFLPPLPGLPLLLINQQSKSLICGIFAVPLEAELVASFFKYQSTLYKTFLEHLTNCVTCTC